jgi:hypothetical protein
VPSREEIESVLPKLGRGAEVRLQLKDGTEVPGRLYGVFDGFVCLDDGSRQVDLDEVENLMVHMHYEETPDGSSPF